MADPFALECSGLPPGSRVVAFEGLEKISATYRYEVDLLVDADAEVGTAVGSAATLTVHSGDAAGGTVHGVIASASVIENLDDTDLYRLLIVPRLQDELGLDRHSRVFVGEAVPAIVQTLLRESGFGHGDCEFRLSRTYEPIDFVCQYRECTLDFLMRWMERDGIYFYFAHDGERERLVIADDKGQDSPSKANVPYVTSLGLAEHLGLRRFRAERHTVPGRVHVDDYDYLRPALPIRGEAAVEGGNHGELRVRGANVATPQDALRIAKLRAEGLRARQTTYRGDGKLPGVHAGERFTLSGHPRASLDGDYLVTKIHVRGHSTGDLGKGLKEILGREDEADEVLRVEVEAISSDVQFRPDLRTPVPRVYSMEGGVIEGDAASDYAQLDPHGRYLVKFAFDERDGRGSKASARIRMMQPHAGSPEGMHFPLRKGTEVLVAFLGGDPDRPVIAGAVPNTLNPAAVRSDNATKNIIHTGGGNRIVMEDSEGKQYVHIASPHKGTYLHLGSTFNPQYNVVKNTDGTSLTYTTQLATSYTGDDTETIAERARITVIGRGMMLAGDQTAANEVSSLLGTGFIDAMEADIPTDLLVWINSGVTATAKDVGTASTDAGTAAKLADWQKILVVLQGSTDAYVQTTCVDKDLNGSSSGAVTPTTYPQEPNGLLDALQQWVTQNPSDTSGQLVQTDAQRVLGDLNNAVIAVKAIITAAVDPPVATLTTPATAAIKTLKTDTATLEADANLMQQASTTAMPGSPAPSVDPQYMNIRRGLSGTEPLPDPTLPAVTTPQDTTALDYLDTGAYPNVLGTVVPLASVATPNQSVSRAVGSPYPLNAGSDVKIVGGDNVTLTANDARSHTQGHAYGLVQAGQTAVAYSAQAYPGAVKWAAGNAAALEAVHDANTAVAQAQQVVVQFLDLLPVTALMSIPQADLPLALGASAAVATLTVANIQRVIADLQAIALTLDPSGAQQFAMLIGKLNALQVALSAQKIANDNLAALTAGASNRPSFNMPYPPSTRPGPRVGPGDAVAQVSTAYGDVNSWVDGSVVQAIMGDKTATINGTVRTVIHGDQHTTLADGSNSVTSEVHGTVNSYVLGSRSTEIIGSDATVVLGAQNKMIVGQQGSIVAGVQTEIIAALKFSLVAAERWALTVGQNFELHNGEIVMSNTKIKQALAQLYVSQVEMHDSLTSMRMHSIGCVMSELFSFL